MLDFTLSASVTESSLCDAIQFQDDDFPEGILCVFTLDIFDVPDWLLLVLKLFCQNKNRTVVCNTKVIHVTQVDGGIGGDCGGGGVFSLGVQVFVRAYCSASHLKSIHLLSKLSSIRSTPNLSCPDLRPLQDSLVSGWHQNHVVICSWNDDVILDGATRVFIVNALRDKIPELPSELPCVNCLPRTPIWILNEILALLSQASDRRVWTPGDTLNLASFQIEALQRSPKNVSEAAVKNMRNEKVFQNCTIFIDLAQAANSRKICTDLSKNLILKQNQLVFYQHLSPKNTLQYLNKIKSGCDHCKVGVEEEFLGFLQEVGEIKARKAASAVSALCNKIFTKFSDNSLENGIEVTLTTSRATEKFKLKWNSADFRHESASHYVCIGAAQYSRFELWSRKGKGELVATKSVHNLIEALGCIQGIALWVPETRGNSVEVTALNEPFESASDDSSDSDVPDAEAKKPKKPKPRPRREPSKKVPPQKKKQKVAAIDPISASKFPFLAMHHLWSSLQSAEHDFQTLWQHLQYSAPDAFFVPKMEARLLQLLQYHADLYSDPRFTDMAPRLIAGANIQKGAALTKVQSFALQTFLNKYGWLVTPVLWTQAELLLLLTAVFHPRLLFIHLIQKKEGKCFLQFRQLLR